MIDTKLLRLTTTLLLLILVAASAAAQKKKPREDVRVVTIPISIFTDQELPRNPANKVMKPLLKQAVMVDMRNVYEPDDMSEAGFRYVAVGRLGAA